IPQHLSRLSRNTDRSDKLPLPFSCEMDDETRWNGRQRLVGAVGKRHRVIPRETLRGKSSSRTGGWAPSSLVQAPGHFIGDWRRQEPEAIPQVQREFRSLGWIRIHIPGGSAHDKTGWTKPNKVERNPRR